MANSLLFSCLKANGTQQKYSADAEVDLKLVNNIWAQNKKLGERKRTAMSMWGMAISNKYLHRWNLADSADCSTCKYTETSVHICTECKAPALVEVRKEWAGAMHTAITDHLGHGRVQVNLDQMLKLWHLDDEEMVMWGPGGAPMHFTNAFASESGCHNMLAFGAHSSISKFVCIKVSPFIKGPVSLLFSTLFNMCFLVCNMPFCCQVRFKGSNAAIHITI
jgi:hypothetical protein